MTARKEPGLDRRVERTRHALLGAPNAMLLGGRRARDIRAAEIASAANVGRSTFYEHYSGPDAAFLDAARHPFGQLADALTGLTGPEALEPLLEHFWQNRHLARDTMERLAKPMSRLLTDMVEERLAAADTKTVIPPRLAAQQIAEAGMAPLRGWVLAEAPCAPATLAASLCRTAAAMRAALAPPD